MRELGACAWSTGNIFFPKTSTDVYPAVCFENLTRSLLRKPPPNSTELLRHNDPLSADKLQLDLEDKHENSGVESKDWLIDGRKLTNMDATMKDGPIRKLSFRPDLITQDMPICTSASLRLSWKGCGISECDRGLGRTSLRESHYAIP